MSALPESMGWERRLGPGLQEAVFREGEHVCRLRGVELGEETLARERRIKPL